MSKMKKIVLTIAALAVSAFPVAQANQVRLDGVGFDIIYDDSLLGLFGAPALLGNTLVFNPTTFSALSTDGSWALKNSTIGLTIIADSGFTLSSASLVERGDYLKFGATSTVFAAGETRAYDFRTPTVETVSLISGAEPVALNVHDIPMITNWQATSSQSFAAGASEVHYTIQNLLGANGGGAGGLAFIEKKYVALSVVSAVPEASQYGMLLLGLGLLGGLHKRRKAS